MRITLNQDPEAVTKARTDADLTKTALAKCVGRSLSLISEIEGGTRNAKQGLLELIADATGVPVERLQAGEPSGKTASATTGAVPDVRDAERAVPADVPELRGGPVGRGV